MLTSTAKHFLHCLLLFAFIFIFEVTMFGGIELSHDEDLIDPWETYGYVGATILYTLKLLQFLPLPYILLNFCGLVFYNAFPEEVVIRGSPLQAPFICFRIVTRGDYPQLVRTNAYRNLTKCIDAGLEHFMIEVVTDKAMNLPKDRRVVETVVPTNYRTRNGAMFKSRALQYCLEESVNSLAPTEWIVHLDEETLLTENAVRGILNFVLDGKHHFGQGLITYANEEVVNWVTTFADGFRVAEDMGKLRAQFLLFNRPLLSWKGSYVVTQVKAEQDVSFDNGLEGSVAEDCYFAMKAYKDGYTFTFIEGEMWEKSPYTLWDFVQQRKRWLQGIMLVVHSKAIPWSIKIFLAMSLYSWITTPLSISNMVLTPLCPVPLPPLIHFMCGFVGAVSFYMYIYGVMKSFSLYRFGLLKCSLCIIGALITIPIHIVLDNIAVIWGIFGIKHEFYVVKKDARPQITV